MASLLYLAFLVSGIAGLIYETIWSRYLSLLLGHSAYAQVIVLAAFLGGMALGAAVVGRRSERMRRPWLGYAIVEIIVGLFGLAFHTIYTTASAVAYDSIFPALTAGPPLLFAKWMIAAVLILPQSVLLGMTFPLMSAEVLRRFPATPGRVLALLYFTNGLGGAFGVLFSGFWLVGRAGLAGSLAVAGAMNIVVGLLVAVGAGLRRAVPIADPLPATAIPPALPSLAREGTVMAVPAPAIPRLRTVLLAVSAGTAIASFIYEIAWIRMLALVLGGATHAFELMLSAFILGLALGAFWVRGRIDRFEDPLRALGIVQWAMGALALATLPVYLASFQWTASLLGALTMTSEGYAIFTIARYAIALLVMLPATFCAGITLPLITRTLLRGGAGESAVGTVYAANTIGSVIGVTLAALLLMPLIGLKALLVTGATLDMTLGIWLLSLSRWRVSARREVTLAAIACTVLLVAGIAWQARFDRNLLVSGVYRARRLIDTSGQKIVYYRDGRTATVSAAIENEATVLISTNGKVDASLPSDWLEPPVAGAPPVPLTSDIGTQVLLPLLTLAHAPNARTAAVIGHGSGMSSHFLLGSPHFEQVTTIEIEPEMIVGSKVFHPANRRVFEDVRSRFAREDARAFFAAGNTRYDLILSEPSNPWVSGVSSLFTKEFYDQIDRHLAPNGVFGQWIHLYEIDDELILGILAALHEHFPSYALFYTAPMDMLIVASRRDSLPAPDWSVLQFPGIAADLKRVVPITAQTLDVLPAGGRTTFGPLLDRGIIANSDFEPLLDLGAERGRYLSRTAEGFASLSAPRFNAIAALEGRRIPLATEAWTATPEIDNARAATLSARLRAAGAAAPHMADGDGELSGALYRKRTLEITMAHDAHPADWERWFRTVAAVEADVHGPAAGFADEKFYGSLQRYLARANAPDVTIATAQFMHALAAWDFPAASRAADRVMADPSFGTGWVPPDMLRDGSVVAKLMIGDIAGARRFYDRLTLVGATDLRSRLLGSYLLAAERD